MKRHFLSFILTFSSLTLFGQGLEDNYYLYFDNSAGLQHLTIDTFSNPNNSWQVGNPQKSLFTTALSAPNVIVTDLTNPFPTNDTSVFILTNVAQGFGFEWPHTVNFAGEYYVNSDSLTDFGTIEFSPDNGSTWVDLLNDSVLIDTSNQWYWYWSDNPEKPILTGNSNGWKSFWIGIAELGHFFNVHDGDTVLYRFTFISDSVQSDKDGLMFDNFFFEDWVEGIEEFQNNNLISVYPNPTTSFLYVERTKQSAKEVVQIFNYSGNLMLEDKNFNSMYIDLTKLNLNTGLYFLKYSDTNSYAIKKFIVN